MINSEGKIEVIKANLNVESIEGFSGHSDRRQIFNYLRRMKPKPEKVIVCHGEKTKCHNVAGLVRKNYKVETIVPEILETIRLR